VRFALAYLLSHLVIPTTLPGTNWRRDLEISLNKRLPGTFQCVLGLLIRRADEQSSNGTINKIARAVVSGSRLFNTVFGLPRNGENITRPLGTFQSGSPPGHATINRRGKEDPRFSTVC
jgi:hypothetical protein